MQEKEPPEQVYRMKLVHKNKIRTLQIITLY